MLNSDQHTLIKEYLIYLDTSVAGQKISDHQYQVAEAVTAIMRSEINLALAFLFELVKQSKTHKQLFGIAAGPIEDLLIYSKIPQKEKDIVISTIIQKATHDPKLCFALAGSWGNNTKGLEKIYSLPLVRKFQNMESDKIDTSEYGF